MAGSTPLSNLNDASVCIPYSLAFPAINFGGQNAASKKTEVVLSETDVELPPMMPAKPIEPDSSDTTIVFLLSLIELPSNNWSVSLFFANLGLTTPVILSRSYA